MAAFVALGFVAAVAQPVRADDFSDVQALVTLDENLYGMTNHGVFRLMRMVESPPYALLTVGFGAQGFAGTDYLVEKTPQGWVILEHGKDMLATSELIAGGLSPARAALLLGTHCPARWFVGSKQTQLAERQTAPASETWHASVPPQPESQSIVVPWKGKTFRVHIVRSHDALVCRA